MLNPSPAELLRGTADSLTEVAEGLPVGLARDQLQAAIGLIRKVARALPALHPYLLADIDDLVATLAALKLPKGSVAEFAELISRTADLPTTVPTLDELTIIDLQLREVAAAVAATVLNQSTDATLVALLKRLTEREAALRLSPWER